MEKEMKSADAVLQEKREERGWDEPKFMKVSMAEKIIPLPFTLEEYKSFSLLLAKLALQDRDSKFCEMYFDLQRRATYGNGYPLLDEMRELEQEMWSFGTGEIIESDGKHL